MEKVPNVQQLRYQTKGRETVPMQFANDLSRVLNEYAGKVDRLNGQELDKAREEGKMELVKEIRESIKENIKTDDTESKHIKIDTDIVKILDDKEITKMFLGGKEGEDVDWDSYGGWGWYS